jgi:hypothetical protein
MIGEVLIKKRKIKIILCQEIAKFSKAICYLSKKITKAIKEMEIYL